MSRDTACCSAGICTCLLPPVGVGNIRSSRVCLKKKILLQLSKLSRRQIYDSDDVSLVQGEQCLNIKRRHFVNSSNRPVLHILVCPPGRMVCECACFPFQRLLLWHEWAKRSSCQFRLLKDVISCFFFFSEVNSRLSYSLFDVLGKNRGYLYSLFILCLVVKLV